MKDKKKMPIIKHLKKDIKTEKAEIKSDKSLMSKMKKKGC